MQRLILVTLALGLLVDMLIDIVVPDRVMNVIFVVVLLFIGYKEPLGNERQYKPGAPWLMTLALRQIRGCPSMCS